MEQAKKNLKIEAIVILALAGVALTDVIVTLCRINIAENQLVVLTAKIIIAAISVLLLLPQVFVGVRGLQLAKNPSLPTKGATIWAMILLILAAISTVSGGIAILTNNNGAGHAVSTASSLAEVLIFYDYIRNLQALTAKPE